MTRFMTRDRAAVAAALMLPLASAAILLPWRGAGRTRTLPCCSSSRSSRWRPQGTGCRRLAAVSAAAWFDFFFTQPYERFTISHSSDVTTFVLLLVVGLAVSQLAAYARRLKAITIADAGYLARVVDSAAATQSAGSPDAVVEHVRKQLISMLELRDCRFEYGMLLASRRGSSGTGRCGPATGSGPSTTSASPMRR